MALGRAPGGLEPVLGGGTDHAVDFLKVGHVAIKRIRHIQLLAGTKLHEQRNARARAFRPLPFKCRNMAVVHSQNDVKP